MIDTSPALQVRGPRPRRRAPARPGDDPRRLPRSRSTRSSTRRGATTTARSSTTARSTRLGEHEYRVTAADACHRWFLTERDRARRAGRRRLGDAAAALALQGKLSREVWRGRDGEDWPDVRVLPAPPVAAIAGVDVSVTRTGYTGDRGYEFWIPSTVRSPSGTGCSRPAPTTDSAPAGIRALDVCPRRGRADPARRRVHERPARASRRSRSTPRSSSASDASSTFDKAAAFTGRRALLAERSDGGPGAAARRAGARLVRRSRDCSRSTAWRRTISLPVQRAPVPVYREGGQVGRATSLTWGPTIKKMVGFGSVDRVCTKPGTRVSRGVDRGGRAREGRRHRRADAVPRPRAQAHLAPLRRSVRAILGP